MLFVFAWQSQSSLLSLPPAATWGLWSAWSRCSSSCGGGRRTRLRPCLNGNTCAGESQQFERCNTQPCPPRKLNHMHCLLLIRMETSEPMLHGHRLFIWIALDSQARPSVMGDGLVRLTKLCRSLILKGAQCLMYTQRFDLLRFGEKTETTKVLVRADRKAVMWANSPETEVVCGYSYSEKQMVI